MDGVRESLKEVEHTITLPEWMESVPEDVHHLVIWEIYISFGKEQMLLLFCWGRELMDS
ncbi:hypothetical protein [Paenibacillus dendrobii]|uniref:hypothetical protein n=1 Tax=Paenibacillus dendrobii TaxID=2691084 RepID=UPI001367B62C|nr:hypothetical protein [Paenibacillus dendrobii]